MSYSRPTLQLEFHEVCTIKLLKYYQRVILNLRMEIKQ